MRDGWTKTGRGDKTVYRHEESGAVVRMTQPEDMDDDAFAKRLDEHMADAERTAEQPGFVRAFAPPAEMKGE